MDIIFVSQSVRIRKIESMTSAYSIRMFVL